MSPYRRLFMKLNICLLSLSLKKDKLLEKNLKNLGKFQQ